MHRAAKGVGKQVTAALESLKMGWGGGSGRSSPCNNNASSPRGGGLPAPSLLLDPRKKGLMRLAEGSAGVKRLVSSKDVSVTLATLKLRHQGKL